MSPQCSAQPQMRWRRQEERWVQRRLYWEPARFENVMHREEARREHFRTVWGCGLPIWLPGLETGSMSVRMKSLKKATPLVNTTQLGTVLHSRSTLNLLNDVSINLDNCEYSKFPGIASLHQKQLMSSGRQLVQKTRARRYHNKTRSFGCLPRLNQR